MSVLHNVLSYIRLILVDILIILGIISISIGAFLFSPIAGFITTGILLLLFAYSLLKLGGD